MFPKDRTGKAEFLYKADYFEPGGEYRFEITPINQYGAAGAPIYATAKAPSDFAKAKTIYVSENPMQELEFGRPKAAKRHVVAADGFYGPISGGQWLKLPEGIFKGPKGTKYRATLDMHTVQPTEGSLWSVKFQDPTSPVGASTRIPTPPGDSGDERYVLELVKRADVETYYIQFDWGTSGRVKFKRIKIEQLGG